MMMDRWVQPGTPAIHHQRTDAHDRPGGGYFPLVLVAHSAAPDAL
jgi:hypothetical protein